jgi:hypothetical protein
MNGEDLQTALELIEVHWPWPAITATELIAWRRNLRPLDFDQAVETLDAIAASGNRFRPSIGIVIDAYRAKSRAKYAPSPVVVAPELPKEVTRAAIAHAREALGPVGRHWCAREEAS